MGASDLEKTLASFDWRAITPEDSPKTPLELRASFGLCLVSEETPLKETIEQADRALYQSKSDGRNRLTLWTVELDHAE